MRWGGSLEGLGGEGGRCGGVRCGGEGGGEGRGGGVFGGLEFFYRCFQVGWIKGGILEGLGGGGERGGGGGGGRQREGRGAGYLVSWGFLPMFSRLWFGVLGQSPSAAAVCFQRTGCDRKRCFVCWSLPCEPIL